MHTLNLAQVGNIHHISVVVGKDWLKTTGTISKYTEVPLLCVATGFDKSGRN